MYNSSSVCSVSYQARALCAQTAATERHRFLVGTCSLHDSNELSVLQYTEDANHFDVTAVYSHPDQIWALEASPKDSSMVVTSRQAQNCSKALTLWKMEKQSVDDMDEDEAGTSSYNHDQLELSEIASFNQSLKPATVRCMRWHNRDDTLLSVDNKLLSVWKFGDAKVSQVSVLPVSGDADGSTVPTTAKELGGLEEFTVAWDPHSSKQCAFGSGDLLRLVDTREMEVTAEKQRVHDGNIMSIDYNPNKSQTLITAGADRKVKFWDVRMWDRGPVKVLAGHSHWVRSAKYNLFHDQLVISGGSDNIVNLWRIASCSSSQWLGTEDSSNDPPDVKVRGMDQHEDCVYGVAWSPADAWIYCSLSYDGRVMVNHVPSTEKYKILL